MYRFLDKRFYRRIRLDFDLRTLACEHIGLSRSYAPTELKRRLKPALEELEQLGFLEVLSPDERYSYVKRGTWRIILIRGRRGHSEPDEEPSSEPDDLVDDLRSRGVTVKTAQDLVAGHPATRIRTKIEVFDWLIRNEDKRVGKNPAGYLVASIRSDYQEPGDYRASAEAEATAQGARARRAAAEAKAADDRAAAEASARSDKEREAKLRAAWEKLPTDQRDAILASVKADNPGLSRWKNMLEPLCLAALEARLRDPKAATSQPRLFPEPDPVE
jgi:hypothetical protein